MKKGKLFMVGKYSWEDSIFKEIWYSEKTILNPFKCSTACNFITLQTHVVPCFLKYLYFGSQQLIFLSPFGYGNWSCLEKVFGTAQKIPLEKDSSNCSCVQCGETLLQSITQLICCIKIGVALDDQLICLILF